MWQNLVTNAGSSAFKSAMILRSRWASAGETSCRSEFRLSRIDLRLSIFNWVGVELSIPSVAPKATPARDKEVCGGAPGFESLVCTPGRVSCASIRTSYQVLSSKLTTRLFMSVSGGSERIGFPVNGLIGGSTVLSRRRESLGERS